MSKPVSKKPVPKIDFNPADIYKSQLDVNSELKKELKEKNLVYRWINAKQFQQSFGFHRSGWVPYKRSSSTKVDSLFGGDPEGYVRRGDLVLAVKSTEDQAKHKAGIAYKTSLYSGLNRKQAQQLAESARQAGFKTKVSEGYENQGEEGDEDDDT
jgi:hypothetical protein